MAAARRAVIDVGTNSVKLLVADVHDRTVDPVWERSHQTRLGEGFYDTHRLQPGPIAQTAQAVADFAAKARELGAGSIRVIATSAAREALNPGDLLHAIRHASGLETKIISGEQEADLAFRGVTTNPEFSDCPLLLLEIGGGSTQFILGLGPHCHFCQSCPLGSVRLLSRSPHSDPPTPGELDRCRAFVREFLHSKLRPGLTPAMEREVTADPRHASTRLVGTGGTMSILARMEAGLDDYDREKMEAVCLHRTRVRWHVETLWSMPLEARRRIRGLPPNRADVILTGTVICESVMEEFGFDQVRVSTRGLRFGALLSG